MFTWDQKWKIFELNWNIDFIDLNLDLNWNFILPWKLSLNVTFYCRRNTNQSEITEHVGGNNVGIYWRSFAEEASLVQRTVISTVIKHSQKQLGICTEYIYISEFMLWLHRGKFVNIEWAKIPCLATLRVAKYLKIVKYYAWVFKE